MEQDKYVGKRLEGRYDIIESIGKGGMANVYKAMDLIDERIVAVKILRDEYLDNTEFLRRFKNESKAIAVLSHPNIVRVYDVSFTDSVHSIVMEYIDGVPLKSYIERQGAIEWKHALHFTLQILHALQHAHDKGIVHRDIKPQNIMLLENGDIKVTDFGIARFARSEVRTISDRAIGTVHYISPEQAMGGNTDEKSDIYSVGVMLFEMLTGKLPFEAESAMSVAMKQIHSQVTRPRSLNPAIPEGLEEITLRAMQKQQKYRYQSAAEMISDIEKFRAAPNTRFGYQFPAEDKNANGDKPRVRNPNHVSRDRGVRADRDREEIVEHKVKTPFLPILTGVTLAFMLAAMAFVGLMLYINNPFMVVAEETLPNLIGIKLDTALHQYDFFDIIVETEEFSNEYGLGVIFEQRPRPNTSIRVGSAVRVTVSRGQEIVTLPNFAGVSASQTISKIIDLGLRVNEVRMFSDEVSAGRVVYTDPSRDSLVGSGETVTVYVSNGPEVRLTSVPNLIGQNIDTAIRLLEQRGLALGEVVEVPSDWPSGTIVSHDPVEGDLQMEGTMINVEVSSEGLRRYEIPIPMPPNIDRMVTIRAWTSTIEDTEAKTMIHESRLNPYETHTWSPDFSGIEGTSIFVYVYIEGMLYHQYLLDFADGGRRLVSDRSSAEEFQS